MLKKPFDDLNNVTKAVELYKNGDSLLKVACALDTTMRDVRIALIFSGVTLRGVGGRRFKKEASEVKPKGKYDHLIFEPINQGHNYDEIVEKQRLKKPPLY